MVSKWSVLIVSGLVYAASLKVIEACQGGGGGQPFRPPDLEQSLLQCLKEHKVNDIENLRSLSNSDVQCAMKYAWLNYGGSSRKWDNQTTWPKNYIKMFNYKEPVRQNIAIDAKCGKMGANSPPGKNFVAVTWFCLEHCEEECQRMSEPGQYPVGGVSCDGTGSTATGCQEERMCKCRSKSGEPCGPGKKITFLDIVKRYNDTCLNCRNYRLSNPQDPMKSCMTAMKDWMAIKPRESVMGLFVKKWDNKYGFYVKNRNG